ncbi:hypothetical protein BDV95DRAFT_390907 [Massariosphaeria phaeospora]|uniref:Uncharacterized protein n=1 Tax=Massariosphaeria phaeospora TaxID=100035 RepID=A0A7C8IF56_9PLEO|nr:hypothetical protein BDV95DRAFT_390907 [Massariosphaeria phaeospora]
MAGRRHQAEGGSSLVRLGKGAERETKRHGGGTRACSRVVQSVRRCVVVSLFIALPVPVPPVLCQPAISCAVEQVVPAAKTRPSAAARLEGGGGGLSCLAAGSLHFPRPARPPCHSTAHRTPHTAPNNNNHPVASAPLAPRRALARQSQRPIPAGTSHFPKRSDAWANTAAAQSLLVSAPSCSVLA